MSVCDRPRSPRSIWLPKLDDIGVPIFELQIERLVEICGEIAEGRVERDERLALVERRQVIEQQRLDIDDDEHAIDIGIEVADFALLVDGFVPALAGVQKRLVVEQLLNASSVSISVKSSAG